MAQRIAIDPPPAASPSSGEARPVDGPLAGAPEAPPHADGLGDAVPDGVDPLSYRVFRAFTRALRAHGRMMMVTLGEEGMHPGQAFCLRTLARHDGMVQRDLAAALHVSRPTVTAMLQRMERDGMVRRAPDETDQRISRVYLTDEGRRRERSLAAVLLAYNASVLDSIPTHDRLDLERLLGQLADNLSAALAERAGEPCRDDRPGEEVP